MRVAFYWKPTCATCRRVKKELQQAGIELELVELFKQPPPRDVLRKLIERYGVDGILRKNSRDYKRLGLRNRKLSPDEAVELLLANPDLIKRPVVKASSLIFAGRDEEALKILKRQTK
ncbi:MAG: arsenate reductase (glutaredoxin) [Aigarchaeota archaeon]|nr:arsenate reductase (glutaredoxin) [Candidatus Pelearchaeum maunauluense]